MKPKMTMLALILASAGGVAGAATAQQDSPQTVPSASPAAAPAEAAGWVPLSRSSQRVYLIDPSKIRREGDVTTVAVARTRLERLAPDDYSYDVDELELRCASGQSRATTSIAYGSDGVETDRYDDPSPWSGIAPDTLDAFASSVACEGHELSPTRWATIRAFMEAGQP
ncbi:surface-adhesin E family protein [Brevundimonas sp.]|uniref:surface-adhesin E family protein n=1 Tax=Brevundimonas sp. TaxID=1871086 RepID=UPI003BABF612